MNSTSGSRWLFGFQATHIQQWILRSSRLRDIQGASNLLERLCKEDFDNALKRLGSHTILSQNAGAARVLFVDGDDAHRLHLAWPLMVDRLAPGLTMQQALVEVKGDDLAAAQLELGKRLHAGRNAPMVVLPLATPPMRRNPRTGLPAVAARRGKKGEEVLDREILARRAVWEDLQKDRRHGSSPLDERFLGDLSATHTFERGGEDETGALASGYVAVIHADGNDVGSLAADAASKTDPQVFRKFSTDLAKANSTAAARAMAKLKGFARGEREQDVLPARPILLGGDDMTMIVAGDHAFTFAAAYLEEFEKEAKASDGKPITACCGIALVKANFPYDRAHSLAESLCQQAKRKARAAAGNGRTPSSLAFHRVTTSLPGDAETILENELTGPDNVRLTLEAYGVGELAAKAGLPMFEQLQNLARAIRKLPRTQIRELVTLIREQETQAQIAWSRFCEVNRERALSYFDKLLGALRKLRAEKDGYLIRSTPPATPLLDALRLPESKSADQFSTTREEEGVNA